MMQENLDYCKHIRSELEKYYNGEVYRCPECGDVIHIPDFDKLLSAKTGTTLPCGCSIEDINYDIEQLSLYDYFNDVFDIIYYIGGDKEVRGVRLMVACGGPNVYIDTYKYTVELYWWTESATANLGFEVCDAITEMFEEIYKS